MYFEEFNGFTGYGETERQAQIAVGYAAAYLSLSIGDGIQYYEDLPVAWLQDPEGQFQALTNQ